VFQPGIVLGAASNGSATLLGGIGYYVRSPEFSLPVLAEISASTTGVTVNNLTAQVAGVFFEGGVYGLGWNGTAWLVGGQASWGGGNFGALVGITGQTFTNLTGELRGAFDGGGIFALAWNGSSWLIGGNSSAGTVLVSLQGDVSSDLSSRVVSYDRLGWIQYIGWNGTAWLIGGQGVLGTLTGDRYDDLWPDSPYGGQGVYAAAWNGTAWLIGGGSGRLVLLRDGQLLAGPTLLRSFDQAVLLIVPLSGGWLVGGKGTAPGGGIAPALVYWPGVAPYLDDLSPLVPSSFSSGEIQGGAPSPVFGPGAVALVGEGNYNLSTGHGSGAIAGLSWTS
jgi:hypothetical protein